VAAAGNSKGERGGQHATDNMQHAATVGDAVLPGEAAQVQHCTGDIEARRGGCTVCCRGPFWDRYPGTSPL
jgi:hypothetical protein